MSYITYPNLPAQQTQFDLIQTRKQEIITYYEAYMKVLRAVEIEATVQGTVVASDIPDAPPSPITYP